MSQYEGLVAGPRETMRGISGHRSLDADKALLKTAEARLRMPICCRPEFAAAEAEAIHERTASVAASFGYA